MAEPYAMPSASHLHPTSAPGTVPDNGREKRPWQTRLPFASSLLPNSHQESDEMLTARAPSRWSVNFFRGMVDDIKRRAPCYWSDWKDAWDYRVVPATVYMYFAKQVVPTQLLASSDLTCVPLFHVISHLIQPPTPLTCYASISLAFLSPPLRRCKEAAVYSIVILTTAFCPLWPFLSTCSPRRQVALASMRFYLHLCSARSSFPSLLANLWSSWVSRVNIIGVLRKKYDMD